MSASEYSYLCDFSNTIKIIIEYIAEEYYSDQPDIFYKLFESYANDKASGNSVFDSPSVNRYIHGVDRIKDKVRAYYLSQNDRSALIKDIKNNILPIMYDSTSAVNAAYDLLEHDISISETKRDELEKYYSTASKHDEAVFLAEILCYTFERPFIKHNKTGNILIKSGNISPLIKDVIPDVKAPKCCENFCGRDNELEKLHKVLIEKEKVFLCGIGGIGKSELAKAYAKKYKKLYTNIIYLSYEGNLKKTISNIIFTNDKADETEEKLFQKHNRYLRTLNSDTLIIIDNFNVTAIQDKLLPVVMKYRCRILFTTRSKFDYYASFELTEIEDVETLLNLMTEYFQDGKYCMDILKQIIETVHSHTLAVELASKLLENGILEPQELLNKLRTEKVALNSSDKIKIRKDEQNIKETYYGHIHILFSLYKLSEAEQHIMRNMSLMPIKGINGRMFAKWLSLSDMNVIDDLKEIGFINSQGRHLIALHPIIQEISEADLRPSINKCKTLCSNIQWICRHHGENISYYRDLFQIVENIINIADKDDIAFYLRFLEDVFPYMETYKYESGMQQILSEMEIILKQESTRTVNDVVLFYDYKATCEKNMNKAIKLEKEALELLTNINSDNAHLASNIHANIGALYGKVKQIKLAKEHMGIGIQLLIEYNLTNTHDAIPQLCNFASYLNDNKEFETSYKILKDVERAMENNNLDMYSDYAVVKELLGSVCLTQGKTYEARQNFEKAVQIYQSVWEDEPELLNEKYKEIQARYIQAGIDIAQTYFIKNK